MHLLSVQNTTQLGQLSAEMGGEGCHEAVPSANIYQIFMRSGPGLASYLRDSDFSSGLLS